MNGFDHRLDLAARVSVGLALCLPFAWIRDASARCVAEEQALALSYPDASTVAVPPDAVLWLVPKLGRVDVRLDGAELAPLGSSPAEQFQFKPADPLAIGEHQLDVRISPVFISDESDPKDVQLRFMVMDLPFRAGDVEPLEAQRISNGDRQPALELPASCGEATLLTGQCDDIGRPAADWLTFAPIGEPLFYLVNGERLLRVGCELTAVRIWDEQSIVLHEIAAVLPTGVQEARVLEAGPSSGTAASGAGCATTPAQPHTRPSWVMFAALLALAWRGQRRRSEAAPRA